MSNELKVSVCSIVYNHAAYVEKMISSIAAQQTSYHFDLIILDDNSTDETGQVVEKVRNNTRNLDIKYIRNHSNLGAIPNFIKSLQQCDGQFILFCEGDDYWNDPQKLQKQVDFLKDNQAYVATFHPVCVVDSSGKIIKEHKSSKLYNHDVSSKELMRGFTISLSAICFRNVINEYPEEFYKVNLGDKFLCSLLGHYGGAKFLSDIKPSAYRFHSGGVWSEKSELDKEKAFINSHYWMWKYYERIRDETLANHFFKLILKKGYLSSPFNSKGYGRTDKLEYLSLWVLRRFFRVVRYLFKSR